MKETVPLAEAAALLCEPSRAKMVQCLLDGRFHTATELAVYAGITPQTASHHLYKMTECNLVQVKKNGRHRYYRLSSAEAAQMIESLLCIAPPEKIRSLKQFDRYHAIRFARTCYDHLAGKVGVALTEAMRDLAILEQRENCFYLTEKGKLCLQEFGIDVTAALKKRRSFARCCLDWSERRYHLAGSLGHAILERLLTLEWIRRLPHTRAVQVTEEGKRGFSQVFGLDVRNEPFNPIGDTGIRPEVNRKGELS
ncbi:DNA-binding transcriptional regulator, ArsR family [Lihuaxuella thermophila]|uniref:DNA-binding transcriptional regulator, ArsR family n=1 Tax=Lihuaxuella thermophila TaxID=1173111 RepID=A0A1H8JMV6_9BACL|nr:winged helix-turn-helix domain-containing protein [Lihuaxuella thermophila]SEN81881.1 DNA-binding transcriptional regulator, ArsR family [Lihuaxuella thermophila]